MVCQIIFSEKNKKKKNSINLSSAEYALGMLSVIKASKRKPFYPEKDRFHTKIEVYWVFFTQ